MDHVESLVRWVMIYSLSGGFWHFVGCWMLVALMTRIFFFVRLIERKPESRPKAKSKSSGEEDDD